MTAVLEHSAPMNTALLFRNEGTDYVDFAMLAILATRTLSFNYSMQFLNSSNA